MMVSQPFIIQKQPINDLFEMVKLELYRKDHVFTCSDAALGFVEVFDIFHVRQHDRSE